MQLDYRRQPGQSRGAIPDVGRALRTYWTVERDKARGVSQNAAWRRIDEAGGLGDESRGLSDWLGSARYQHGQGREYHRLLAECWGDALPRLVAETMGWKF